MKYRIVGRGTVKDKDEPEILKKVSKHMQELLDEKDFKVGMSISFYNVIATVPRALTEEEKTEMRKIIIEEARGKFDNVTAEIEEV